MDTSGGAVSRMVAAGHRIIFEQGVAGRDISRCIHKRAGEITHFTLRNGVYEIELALDEESFPRPVNGQ